jgi:hypothetical protein
MIFIQLGISLIHDSLTALYIFLDEIERKFHCKMVNYNISSLIITLKLEIRSFKKTDFASNRFS